jgi:hypothetical protein
LFYKEERLKKENELKMLQESQIKKHVNSFRCRLYKFMGSHCQKCMTFIPETLYSHRLSEKYTIEEGEQVSQSSSSATIDTDMEPSLLGMVTLNDMLSLLVDNKLNDATKAGAMLDFTSIPMKQVTL